MSERLSTNLALGGVLLNPEPAKPEYKARPVIELSGVYKLDTPYLEVIQLALPNANHVKLVSSAKDIATHIPDSDKILTIHCYGYNVLPIDRYKEYVTLEFIWNGYTYTIDCKVIRFESESQYMEGNEEYVVSNAIGCKVYSMSKQPITHSTVIEYSTIGSTAILEHSADPSI